MNKRWMITHTIGNNGRDPIPTTEIYYDEEGAFDYALDCEALGNCYLHEVLEIDPLEGKCTNITRRWEIALDEAVADARSLARHNASFARPSGY